MPVYPISSMMTSFLFMPDWKQENNWKSKINIIFSGRNMKLRNSIIRKKRSFAGIPPGRMERLQILGIFPTGGVAAVPVTPLEVRTCVKCHTEHDSIAGGHCDDCHKKKDPAMSGKPLLVTRRPDPTYAHDSPGHRAWTEEGRCADCHGEDIWKAKTIQEIVNPGEDAPVCVDCHVKKRARFHWR